MSSEGSDIAQGIIQDKLPEHIARPRAEFSPWHKVRKQFIRRYQWNELTKRNVNDAWRAELQKPSDSVGQGRSTMLVTSPLRCLVIPGNHLLDMRSLWGELAPLDCFIRYLGFNEGQGSAQTGTDVHIANNAMTSLGGVVPDSQVVKDRFESIAGNTFAYKSLRQYGPYHVVNLDLCGSMFPNTAKSVEPYYNALHKLVVYQFEAQKARWLLFVTTMVEPAVVDELLMQKLCEPTCENLTAHADFAEKMKALCAEAIPGDEAGGGINLAGLSGENLIRLFGVALGKWLLRFGQVASPKWTVSMRRSYRYTTNAHKGAVMLSLAFEMTPNITAPADATGMSSLHVPEKRFQSEVECAIKIAKSVENISDVDHVLSDDPIKKADLFKESADLLEAAGFDRGAYIKWVNDGEHTGLE